MSKTENAADLSMMGDGEVTVTLAAPYVACVQIQRPPANYFDVSLLESLGSIYRRLELETDIRAIVLSSNGKHFCAGADFTGSSDAEPVSADEGATKLYSAAAVLFQTSLPVVAAIQGAAIGGGTGLALSADFRVVSRTARISANFSRLGFHQGFGLSVTLPMVVGRQKAADLLFTGRSVGGQEAVDIGLCDRLAEPEELLSSAIAFAVEIAAAAPLAVRSIRATLRGDLASEVVEAMRHELAEQAQLRATEDFAEGIAASKERRQPRFNGA
ncbi:enoyl-CoA hydratase/isomerase family protein [Specibacter sp. RAF43]|uniref:enoyl-CoA hydratase/isomerase family protein n=1 Tax=Specibacter sp. RAF43 TaxID=3233057 RepID=UPI003F963A81